MGNNKVWIIFITLQRVPGKNLTGTIIYNFSYSISVFVIFQTFLGFPKILFSVQDGYKQG